MAQRAGVCVARGVVAAVTGDAGDGFPISGSDFSLQRHPVEKNISHWLIYPLFPLIGPGMVLQSFCGHRPLLSCVWVNADQSAACSPFVVYKGLPGR